MFNRATDTKAVIDQLLQNKQQHYTFHNAESGSTEIQIIDEIDDWWGFGVRELSYELRYASNPNILVKLHSPGGSVHEGIGIRNLLINHDGEVTTFGIGLVASIATVILLAGDKVQMADDAFFMIHNPWAGVVGESDEMRSTAETLDKMRDTIVNIYLKAIEKNGKLINNSREETTTQLISWMDAETWFTAQEALEHGFIGEVVNGENSISTTNAKVYDKYLKSYKNMPAALKSNIQNQINMSKKKKKSFLDSIKGLINQHEDTATEETAAEETEGATDEAIQAARELLESQGYDVNETETEEEEQAAEEEEETATEETEEEESEETAEAIEELVSQRVETELAALRNELSQEAFKTKGAPSGGKPSGKKKATAKRNIAREKAFGGFAQTLVKIAKQG